MLEMTAETRKTKEDKKPHYHGHRQRLREKFIASGGEGLPDYEMLELLLMLAIPRKDVKPLAKELIATFGTFAKVITAGIEELTAVEGVKENTAAAIKLVQAAAVRMLKDETAGACILNDFEKVLDYCRASMAFGKTEQFRVLFLDVKNRLIADELQQKGTINHTPLYPREVVKRALELSANAIILVHNHPSGDTKPSKADIKTTKQVDEAAKALGVTLHDHFIVTRTEYFSFRENRVI